MLSFWRKWALGSPTNRFLLVWDKSSNGKWLKTAFGKKKRPFTSISRGNARDALSLYAFKFAPSCHAFDLHTLLRLTRALPRSLVVEGSVVRSWFLSNCSTCVPVFAPGITGSPSKRICCGTVSQKTRIWYMWQAAHGYVASEGPRLGTSALWKVSLHDLSEDQRVFVCVKPSLL